MTRLTQSEAKEAGRRGGLTTQARRAGQMEIFIAAERPAWVEVFTHRAIPEGEERCASCFHGLTSEHDENGKCRVRVCGHQIPQARDV